MSPRKRELRLLVFCQRIGRGLVAEFRMAFAAVIIVGLFELPVVLVLMAVGAMSEGEVKRFGERDRLTRRMALIASYLGMAPAERVCRAVVIERRAHRRSPSCSFMA